MAESYDPNFIPSHIHLSLPEHMEPQDYQHLLRILGEFGITKIYTQETQLDDKDRFPSPLPETPEEVKVPIVVDEFIDFAREINVTEIMARGTWNALQKFCLNRKSREAYLQRPISETTQSIRDRVEKAQQLPLASDTIECDGQIIERIDFLSLYHTLEILLQKDPTLIQGIGAKRIKLLTQFVNSRINTTSHSSFALCELIN